MNKLQAVNSMRGALGQPHASQLDSTGPSEVGHAERLLDDASIRVQAEGWAFNERTATLTPSSDQITAPSGVIAIEGADQDAYRRIAVDDTLLIDLDTGTNTFTAPIKVRYTVQATWLDIPAPIRQYIAADAAMAYAQFKSRTELLGLLDRRRTEARVKARRADTASGKINILDTDEAREARGYRSTSWRYMP